MPIRVGCATGEGGPCPGEGGSRSSPASWRAAAPHPTRRAPPPAHSPQQCAHVRLASQARES
eukprot:5050415-Prymnesium_polylepis.2